MKAKSYLIFSAVAILQQKISMMEEVWVVKANSIQMFSSFLCRFSMDYVNEFYSIYTIIITYVIKLHA